MEASAFSPSHITGFFKIVDEESEPLLKGSMGAGISLSKGVKTHMKIKESFSPELEVIVNDKILISTQLTRYMIDKLLQGDRKYSILVNHEIEVPIGSGFGSSGACILSLALAINEALGIGLSKIKVAQFAHLAEIEYKTGLGTVIAETYGGFEVRIKAGAPGIGKIEQIPVGNDYSVVCLNLSPISTKKVLNDRNLCKCINESSKGLINSLMEKRSPENFMKLSRKFADSINIFTNGIKNVLNEVDLYGFTCSMAMIGESIFSFTKTAEAKELAKIFYKYARSEKDLIFSSIDREGARPL